jgi:hypothetical protein
MSINDPTGLSRRRFFVRAAAVAIASGLRAAPALAADLPHLAETDPAAQALGYVDDTGRVPPGKYPKHQAAQECDRCNLYQGAAGAQWGPCLIFPGKAVHAGGWCSAYTPKQ